MSKNSQTKMNTFTQELGKLLSLKIDSYLKKYHKGIESLFFNQFIHCAYEGEMNISHIRRGARARRHFEDNLGINLFGFYLNLVGLTKNREIQYSFFCTTNFYDTEESEALNLNLVGQVISIENEETLWFLQDIEDDILDKHILKIQKLISTATKRMR
jgi:hypothetical protein